MRLAYVLVIVAALAGCSNPVKYGPFTLKFINIGTYRIDSLFLKPIADTADWGASILPVPGLDNVQFVVFRGLAGGPTYAFKVQFDSAGTPVVLRNTSMQSTRDSITAYAGLGPNLRETGSSLGWARWPGEQDVTP